MDVLSDRQTRALAFVEACNSAGYRPSGQELQLWLDSPTRRMPSSRFGQMAAAALSAGLRGEGSLLASVPGTGESEVEHLQRLRWLNSGERLALTPLGTALLQSANRSKIAAAESDAVILDRDDPLAYAALIGHMAEAKASLLVDPYLRLEQLHDLIVHTDVSRFLMSKQWDKSKSVRASMSVYLASERSLRAVEVRASKDPDLHDRLIIGERGVELLGYSMNGINRGVASTTLVRLPGAASVAMNDKVESWWVSAERIDPKAEDE